MSWIFRCQVDSEPKANKFDWLLLPLTRIASKPVSNSSSLSQILDSHQIGSAVELDDLTLLAQSETNELAIETAEAGLLYCRAANRLGWQDGFCLSATIVGPGEFQSLST